MKFAAEIKVGFLVLAGIGLFGYSVHLLNEGAFQKPGYEVKVIFPTAAGMQEKAPVYMAGVQVGQVKRVRLTPKNRVLVTLSLNPRIKIKDSSGFLITTESFFGIDKFVEIIPGEEGKIVTAGHKPFMGEQPLVAREVLSSLKKSMEKFQGLSESLDGFLGDEELKAALKQTVVNVGRATEEMFRLAYRVNSIVSSKQDQIKDIVDNLQQITENINQMVADAEMKKDVKEIITSLKETGKKVESITEKLDTQILSQENMDGFKTAVKKTNSILEKVDKKIGSFKLMKPKANLEVFGSDDDKGNTKYNTTLNVTIPSPTGSWYTVAGIEDVSERNKGNLLLGKKIGKGFKVQGGLREGKLGGGVIYDKKAVQLKLEGIDPNEPHFHFYSGLKVAPGLYFLWWNEFKNSSTNQNWLGVGIEK